MELLVRRFWIQCLIQFSSCLSLGTWKKHSLFSPSWASLHSKTNTPLQSYFVGSSAVHKHRFPQCKATPSVVSLPGRVCQTLSSHTGMDSASSARFPAPSPCWFGHAFLTQPSSRLLFCLPVLTWPYQHHSCPLHLQENNGEEPWQIFTTQTLTPLSDVTLGSTPELGKTHSMQKIRCLSALYSATAAWEEWKQSWVCKTMSGRRWRRSDCSRPPSTEELNKLMEGHSSRAIKYKKGSPLA